MENDDTLWVTGTVISASGYPRKNAEVRGVLYEGSHRIGAACSTTDYSGQYVLSIELPDDYQFSVDGSMLHVALSAQSSGETLEYGQDDIVLEGNAVLDRELRLATLSVPRTTHRVADLLRAA